MARETGAEGVVKKTHKRDFLLHRGRKKADHTAMWEDYYDYNLLAVVVLLTCFGLVMLYSTSAYEASVTFDNDMHYFEKQSVISIVAFLVMLIFSRVDYHFYVKYSWGLYIISNILLVATAFIGKTINGARRWIYIGSISFQPAELAKVAVILFIPMLIVKAGHKFKKFKVPAQIGACGIITGILTYVFTEKSVYRSHNYRHYLYTCRCGPPASEETAYLYRMFGPCRFYCDPDLQIYRSP